MTYPVQRMLILSLVLFFPLSARTDQDSRLRSFQQTKDYDISAWGTDGIHLYHHASEKKYVIHKKGPEQQRYDSGYATAPGFRYTAARLYHNRLLIALQTADGSSGSGVDVVQFDNENEFSLIRHFEMEDIRALSFVEKEGYLILLKGSEEKGFSLEIFETDLNTPWTNIGSIPIPYRDVYDFALTTQRQLYNGSQRYYLILTRVSDRPVLCSLKSLVDQTPLETISEIALEGQASLLDLHQTEDHAELTLIYPDESRDRFAMDDILSEAFSRRHGLREAEKKKHASEIKAYQQSNHYKWIKLFAALDSFMRGFVPFDYDLVPKAFNTYIMQTTPERLLKDELFSRNLLNGLTADDAHFFSRDISHIRDTSETAGVIALVSIPVSKGVKAYRAYQATRPDKLDHIANALVNLEKRLGSLKTGEKAFQTTEARIAALKSMEDLLKKPITLKLGHIVKSTLRQGFNIETAKMFPKVLLVTNATWLLGGEMPVQIKRHGPNPADWQWDSRKLAYTGLFLNNLTGAIMVLSGFKINQVARMVILMGIIEGNSQAIQWLLYHGEDIPFDPAQATFDKGYIVIYALPKNQLNCWLQPQLVNTAKAAGCSAGVYQWFIPLSMNMVNEVLGNGGYSWTQDAGGEMIGCRIEEMENLHAFDLEDYLNPDDSTPIDLNQLGK